jgi:hypothetical protein
MAEKFEGCHIYASYEPPLRYAAWVDQHVDDLEYDKSVEGDEGMRLYIDTQIARFQALKQQYMKPREPVTFACPTDTTWNLLKIALTEAFDLPKEMFYSYDQILDAPVVDWPPNIYPPVQSLDAFIQPHKNCDRLPRLNLIIGPKVNWVLEGDYPTIVLPWRL